jgi:hypothetical protein
MTHKNAPAKWIAFAECRCAYASGFGGKIETACRQMPEKSDNAVISGILDHLAFCRGDRETHNLTVLGIRFFFQASSEKAVSIEPIVQLFHRVKY